MKIRCLLTSIVWPYCGLRFRAHQNHLFFESWRLPKCWFSSRSQAQSQLIAFIECSSLCGLESSFMGVTSWKLHRSCALIWPPHSRGKTNYIIAKPCAAHVFRVWSLCFVKCGSLNCGHLPSKIPFSLEILLGTSLILYLFERSLKWPFLGIFFHWGKLKSHITKSYLIANGHFSGWHTLEWGTGQI